MCQPPFNFQGSESPDLQNNCFDQVINQKVSEPE